MLAASNYFVRRLVLRCQSHLKLISRRRRRRSHSGREEGVMGEWNLTVSSREKRFGHCILSLSLTKYTLLLVLVLYICTAIFAVCLARRAHFPSKKSNKAFKFYEKFAHFFSTLFFFVNFAVFFPNCIWIHFMGWEQKMQIIERKEWWGKKHWIAFCTHKSMRKLRERREEMLITFKVRTISIANGWKYLRLTPQKLWNKNSVEKSIRHNQSVIKVFLFFEIWCVDRIFFLNHWNRSSLNVGKFSCQKTKKQCNFHSFHTKFRIFQDHDMHPFHFAIKTVWQRNPNMKRSKKLINN